MDKIDAIKKVNNLLRLAGAGETAEEQTAKELAIKLIEKYQLAPEEIGLEEKPAYGNDELIYESEILLPWKARLALLVGKKNYCYIVQEKQVDSQDQIKFCYFAFGEKEDVENTKSLFNLSLQAIEKLKYDNCWSESIDFTADYLDGVVEGFKSALYYVEVPKIRRIKLDQEIIKKTETTTSIQAPIKEMPKNIPVENKQEVREGTLTRNPIAFIKGLYDGEEIKIKFNLLGD